MGCALGALGLTIGQIAQGGKDESLFRPITLFFTLTNYGSAKHYSNPLLGQSPGGALRQPVGLVEPRRAPACSTPKSCCVFKQRALGRRVSGSMPKGESPDVLISLHVSSFRFDHGMTV